MDLTQRQDAREGSYGFAADDLRTPLMAVSGATDPGDPQVALIRLDGNALDQAKALIRFLCAREGLKVPPDHRVTDYQRQRFAMMFRVLDGRARHAGHRELAEVVFGADRLAGEAWQVSSYRDRLKRMLRDGDRLVRGGYRHLLLPPATTARRRPGTR